MPAPMYSSPKQRSCEIAEAVNLDAAALRGLFNDEQDRLHAAWCELCPSDWDAMVTTPQGKPVPVAATPWMRNREVWVHAVDLGMGAWFDQVPPCYSDAIVRRCCRGLARSRNCSRATRGAGGDSDSIAIGERKRCPRCAGGWAIAVTGAVDDRPRRRGPDRRGILATKVVVNEHHCAQTLAELARA